MTAATEFAAHVDWLRQLRGHSDDTLRTLFDSGRPIYVARAPGRLDVMGGIADYSGSLVLELPIAESAFAAVQVAGGRGVTIVSLRDGEGEGEPPLVKTVSEGEWLGLQRGTLEAACEFFASDPASAWAAYVAGPLLVLLAELRPRVEGGLRILVASAVPEGKGVSSSAAIEVAALRAAAAAVGVSIDGEALARMCQRAENAVVGAPCGIMDQMTSVLGRQDELLALRCQPATIEGFVAVPPGISFWGVDSGVRHFVGGASYSSVRCGAFMGYRIISELAGLRTQVAQDAPRHVDVDDPRWHGYLANIAPSEFHSQWADQVPKRIGGQEFIDRFAGTTDRVTCVDPAQTYAVRAPTQHPIEENDRTHRFRTLLEGAVNEESLCEMGELMYAAHASYSACGLGSPATDELVRLVRKATPAAGLYGAKITGGGSGGTVAILGRSTAGEAVRRIVSRYAEITGRKPHVFQRWSPGAYGTPVQELVI